MSRTRPRFVTRSRRVIFNSLAGVVVLLFLAFFATTLVRSTTGFSRFSRLEYCSLCGVQRVYREICVVDRQVFRSTTEFESSVNRVFKKGLAVPCGHNYYALHQRMRHFSFKTTPFYIDRGGSEHASSVLNHPKFVAALASVHAARPEFARLIWSRTLRHCFHSNQEPLEELHSALQALTAEELNPFLRTNRHFRPARPNPERLFYSR